MQRTHTISLWSLSIILLTASLAWSLTGRVPLVQPRLTCGDTIGPNQAVVLHEDIGPCDDDVATVLTVQGPDALLELNGHSVVCADTDGDGQLPAGIQTHGLRASVRNGLKGTASVGCRKR